jgi:hypothetical protein
MADLCEYGQEPSGSIQCEDFFFLPAKKLQISEELRFRDFVI